MSTYNSSTTKPLHQGTQVVWFIFGFIEILLALRFVLLLLSANPEAAFTATIYSITSFLVSPFTSVFNVTYADGTTFEWTTILAIIVYYAIAKGIVAFLMLGEDISTDEAATRLRNQE